MTAVSGRVRLNIAAMSDADLSLVRGVVARAVGQDPDADPFGLLDAIDDETELRMREPM